MKHLREWVELAGGVFSLTLVVMVLGLAIAALLGF